MANKIEEAQYDNYKKTDQHYAEGLEQELTNSILKYEKALDLLSEVEEVLTPIREYDGVKQYDNSLFEKTLQKIKALKGE